MTPFHGWTAAVRDIPIKSSVVAGNSVRSLLVPMSCAQAYSQAIAQGVHACYLFCAACDLCDLPACQPQPVSCFQ